MKKEFRKTVAYFIAIVAITLFFVASNNLSGLSTAASFETENFISYSIDKPLKTDFPFEH